MRRLALSLCLSFLALPASAQETTPEVPDVETAYYVLHDIEASDNWGFGSPDPITGEAYNIKEDLKARFVNYYTAALQYGQTSDFESHGFITPDLDYTNGTLQELAMEWQCTQNPASPAWVIEQHYSQNSRRFFSTWSTSTPLFWLEVSSFSPSDTPGADGMYHHMLKMHLWKYANRQGMTWRDMFYQDKNRYWAEIDHWRSLPLKDTTTAGMTYEQYLGRMDNTGIEFTFFIRTFDDLSSCAIDPETGEATKVFWRGDYWSDEGGNVYTGLPPLDDDRVAWAPGDPPPPGTGDGQVALDPRDAFSPYNPNGDLDGDNIKNSDESEAEYCGPDGDHDGDGTPNSEDAGWSADICTRDSDGDGMPDRRDPEPLIPDDPENPTDTDGDGIPDRDDAQPNTPATPPDPGGEPAPDDPDDPTQPGKDEICIPGETEGECLNGEEGQVDGYQEAPSRFFEIMSQFVDITELRAAKVCPEIVFPDPGIPYFDIGEIPLPIDCGLLDILGVFVLISAAWFGLMLIFT